MRSSVIIAAGLAIVAVGWMLSGQFGGDPDGSVEVARADLASPGADAPADGGALAAVRVVQSRARPRERVLIVSGRTEPSREVELRAETYGRVAEVLAEKGRHVEAGEVLLRLAIDIRAAHLTEAEALLRQREIEFAAAEELKTKGFRSDTSVAAAQALLDGARAAVQQIRIEIAHTRITAPFAGYVWRNRAELGAYVKTGDTLGAIVDLDPVLVVGYATEHEINLLRLGAVGRAKLIDGTVVEGIVSYISAKADPQTRTYRFELDVPNEDGAIRGGLTAEISIPLTRNMAHLVSPAVLTLGADGTIGVKTVNLQQIVEFKPVTILSDTLDGVWLGGLPADVSVITVGQEFVVAGERVRPVEMAGPLAPGDGV